MNTYNDENNGIPDEYLGKYLSGSEYLDWEESSPFGGLGDTDWNHMAKEYPFIFSLIVFRVISGKGPASIKIGFYNGVDLVDSEGRFYCTWEVAEWAYLNVYMQDAKYIVGKDAFSPAALVRLFTDARENMEDFIHIKTGLTDLRLEYLHMVDNPKGTEIKPGWYMKEDRYTDEGDILYDVYLGIGHAAWIYFQALEDCTKRRF